jgi:amino acid synthesis protein
VSGANSQRLDSPERVGVVVKHDAAAKAPVAVLFYHLVLVAAGRKLPALGAAGDQYEQIAGGAGTIALDLGGEMEHGGACCHPMLGRPMRAAIGGGKAVIGSNVKVAAPGAIFDVPLGHKDDSWSFEHFDTITVSLAGAPRPAEIVVVMAIADGGRLDNRCGSAPIR